MRGNRSLIAITTERVPPVATTFPDERIQRRTPGKAIDHRICKHGTDRLAGRAISHVGWVVTTLGHARPPNQAMDCPKQTSPCIKKINRKVGVRNVKLVLPGDPRFFIILHLK
jgi:hypothetical protein